MCPKIIFSICAIALAAHVTTGSEIPTLDCLPGQFVFKIPSGRYRNDDGVDQAIDPGYACRQCRICPIGAKVIAKCSMFADTICGGCIKEGHVFDEGTKSCQPLYIVEGRLQSYTEERLKSVTGKTTPRTSPECGNGINDGRLDVSTKQVEVLFVVAATLFAIVLFSAVVLVIVACMSAVARRTEKIINSKGEEEEAVKKGRNLPTTIPNLLVDAVKDKVDEMKGYKTLVNTGDDEEQQCRKQSTSCPGNTDRRHKSATSDDVKTGSEHGECLNNV
ncbi:uncharacterized protein [Ptychodera flava]|uniref:uncharacterized protein n=1 Tax=Ptychodera flava TaxID=63121 RepID=UPI00396A52B4